MSSVDDLSTTERAFLQQAKESFITFLYIVWKAIGLPKPTPIQEDIAETLANPPSNRFIIQGFRGVAKSFITCAFVVWLLWRNPNLKIMIVSASKDRADANASFIKKIINELPFLSHLRAGQGQRNTANIFDVGPCKPDHSPSVKSVGITGQLTGSRADVLVADDVEVPNNSYTQTMRERLAELVKEFDAIIKPGGTILYLGTPQTEMTLYNELLSRGYTTLIWPARYPLDHKHRETYGNKLAPFIANRFDKDPEAMAWKPTDPQRFDEEDLCERELSYKRAGFMLQFMLDTTLSDADKYPLKLRDLIIASFPKEAAPMNIIWLPNHQNKYEDLPMVGLRGDAYHSYHNCSQEVLPYTYRLLAVDPSGRGKDETGYSILYYLNGFIFLMKVGGLKSGYSDETLAELAKLAKAWNVHEVVVEGNFGDGMFLKLLEPILVKTHKCTLTEVKSKGQKELRIIDTLEPVVTNHRLVCTTECIKDDFETANRLNEIKYCCMYQLTRVTHDRGALLADDRLDSLAIGVGHLVDLMNISVSDGIEQVTEDWLEGAMESLLGMSTVNIGGVTYTETDEDAVYWKHKNQSKDDLKSIQERARSGRLACQ